MYDINILGNIKDSTPDLDMNGTFITGVAKLVQRFMILLLTDIKTDPFGRGTTIPAVRNVISVADIAGADGTLRIACNNVLQQLDESYTTSTPDDEKIANYTLRVTKQDVDYLSIEITLKTAAGSELTVIMPKTLQQVQKD
jgi:hypothetical protein